MVRLSKSDILIVNGLGAEEFLGDVVDRFPRLKVVTASEGIEPMVSGGEVNSHAWLGVGLHMGQVRKIAKGLAEADPERAARYQANADGYIGRLTVLRDRMLKGLEGVTNRQIVTFHDAFPYFAREFGFVIVSVVQRHPGAEPGAQELKGTIGEIRRRGVGAVFAEPQYPADSARVVAAETGARVVMLDPVVTGPMEADAYLEAMERNLKALRESLTAGGLRADRPGATAR